MKRFLSSVFLLCGVALASAAPPVCGQTDDIVINKKPLKDFAAEVKAKNVDWTKPFLVEAEAVLTDAGRFDKERTRFTKTEGDAATVEAVKQAFEATGESGWLRYLSQSGLKDIKVSAAQSAETFTVSVDSEQPTPERAKTFAAQMNMMVRMVLMLSENNSKRLGDDEKKLLSGTKVTVLEKTVTINVSLAAAEFQEMIRRRLNEKQTEANK